jgi:hypothetical protein
VHILGIFIDENRILQKNIPVRGLGRPYPPFQERLDGLCTPYIPITPLQRGAWCGACGVRAFV